MMNISNQYVLQLAAVRARCLGEKRILSEMSLLRQYEHNSIQNFFFFFTFKVAVAALDSDAFQLKKIIGNNVVSVHSCSL